MKSTVVSFYPAAIEETKPGLIPNVFNIAAADEKNPTFLILSDCKYHIKHLADMPSIQVTVPGEDVCRAFVDDWLKSKLSCVPGIQQPAVFWLPGEWDKKRLEAEKKELINAYLEMQRTWFVDIIKLADNDWAKRPGSHQMITEDAKRAAKALKFERDWLVEIPLAAIASNFRQCKGCASEIAAIAIVCRYCQTVQDEAAYKNLKVANISAVK